MRRHKRMPLMILLVVVTLSVIAAVVWWQPLRQTVMSRRYYYEWTRDSGEVGRGWVLHKRWGQGRAIDVRFDEGKHFQDWYVRTGFMAHQGSSKGWTTWRSDGSIRSQHPVGGPVVVEAPWLWGQGDQTAPSIPPELIEGTRWQALLDGQDEWLDALDRRSEAWTFKVEEGESVDLKAVLEVDARAPDGVEASAPRDRGDRADR